ncbi:MAG: hypothetical protein HPY46_12285 [Candidatus Aminicenantes bacterium]|uniref:Uncharacterized protein n=1 Tax=Candidatus Saccharicenans subterraneus TaxID=2508984 RepID=A0A3E2BM33_9BACT|nr:hypothetical protein [Candidatus Aminicenantes bacterium]RFT15819.1 MAG: hypothetical protein OP8BY_2217 [Candidatus Saccharicenans subterraneum]
MTIEKRKGIIKAGFIFISVICWLAGPALAKDVFRGRMLTERAPIEPPAVEILIEVDSWTTPDEVMQFSEAMAGSGVEAFLNLFKATKKGAVRFLYARGYNLTIHMAQVQQEEDGKKKVILVFRREPWSQGTQLGIGRYYFMVMELRLNEKGKGEGRFYEDAQIQFDVTNGRVFLETYGISPKMIPMIQEVKKK